MISRLNVAGSHLLEQVWATTVKQEVVQGVEGKALLYFGVRSE